MSEVTGLRPDWRTHQAITDLIHAYAFHVDRYEPAAVAALFAPDCQIDYGPGLGLPTRGRDALQQRLTDGLGRFAATSHHVSNIRISAVDAHRCRAVTYLYAWHRFSEHPERPDAVLWGQYHDWFVEIDGHWRFAERVLRVAGHQDFDVEWLGIGRRTPTDAATL